MTLWFRLRFSFTLPVRSVICLRLGLAFPIRSTVGLCFGFTLPVWSVVGLGVGHCFGAASSEDRFGDGVERCGG